MWNCNRKRTGRARDSRGSVGAARVGVAGGSGSKGRVHIWSCVSPPVACCPFSVSVFAMLAMQNGSTALMYAAVGGRVDAMKLLLEKGADPAKENKVSGDACVLCAVCACVGMDLVLCCAVCM